MPSLITSRAEIAEEYCAIDPYAYNKELRVHCAANSICRDVQFYDVDETLDVIRSTDDGEVVALSVMIHALQAPRDGLLRLFDAIRIILAHDHGLTYAYALADETRNEYGIPVVVAAFARMVMHRLPYGFRVDHPFDPYDPTDDDLIALMKGNDLPGVAALLKVDGATLYWFEDLGAAMMAKLHLGAHDRG